MSTTLVQLIHDLADSSMDLVQATADANAADNTTFASSADLLEEDDYYRGSEAYFLDGTNAGVTRRVIGSDFETQTITVIPALPAAILIGDRVELYNVSDGGRQRKNYRDIINRVIRDVSGNYMEPATVDLVGVYGGAQLIPVPTGINTVCQVSYYDTVLAEWFIVKRAGGPGKRGWWPVREDASIGLSDDWMLALNGIQLRFRGLKEPSQLVLDSDTTSIDHEFIIETAAGRSHFSNPDNYQNLGPGQYAMNRADAIRGKMATVPMANCARIR